MKVNRTVPKVEAPASNLAFSILPSDAEIAGAHALPGPLLPVSSAAASRWENRSLAQALLSYRRGDPENTAPLVRFLGDHPGSRFEPALLTNLGQMYKGQGRMGRALPALERAWSLTKDRSDKNSQAIANWALAELADMYGHLDSASRNRLDGILEGLGGRDLHGPATVKVVVARQEQAQLRNRAPEAFRCGPASLALLRAYLHLARDPSIESAPAPAAGFSLAGLQDLANSHGMTMRTIHRQVGAPVPVPSIVHWKYEHYSAVVARKQENGREYFRLENPLLENGRWISRDALEEEESGYYLVMETGVHPGWRQVDRAEAEKLAGRCLFGQFDLTQFMDWAIKVIDDIFAPPCGVPRYDFHAEMVNLHIEDIPLGYTPPLGPPVKFKIAYNHKDSFQPAIFQYSNLGPKWTFDWFSYLNNGGACCTVYLRSGGVERHTVLQDTTTGVIYTTDPQTHAQVRQVKTGFPVAFERDMADGSKEVFTINTGTNSGYNPILMTQAIDAQGNAITFTYDSQFRLVAVTDAIGQVSTLSYELSSDPLKVTKVTDPFGRSAVFGYDSSGHLVQVTDVMGMTSTFRYGANDFIEAMNTPYGTTLFETGQGPDPKDALNTYVQSGDPFGTQRIEFRTTVPAIPATDPFNNSLGDQRLGTPALNTAITAYWDRNASLKAPGDYTQARLYQWLNGQASTGSGVPQYTKNALEGRVVYQYPGEFNGGDGAYHLGSSAMPGTVLRLLEDGKTEQRTVIEQNDLGHITKYIDPAGRETDYFYDPNEIDLLQVINPTTFDTLATISYNSQHEPTSYTDVAGQTTARTYNGRGQLLSMTDAKGEITTFVYDANGYLSSVTGPLPEAVRTFTYDSYGRLRTTTDSDGYTLTYDYDALNRLTKTTYPDQTFEQTTYDKLDLVAFADRQGRVTRTSYDVLRRPVSITDPLGQVTKFGWCGCGGIASLTDPKGNLTTWNRDVQGRPTSKVYADGSSVQYSYDPMTGRFLKITDPKGQLTNYQYDADGKIKQISYSGGAATPAVSFSYDPVWNRLTGFTDGTGATTYSYVSPGTLGALQVASVSGPRGEQLSYGYDELGRVVSRAIDSVPMQLTYDPLGRLVRYTNALGSFTYTYAGASGRVQSVNYPNGQAAQYSYFDTTGDLRLLEIQNLDSNQNLLSQFDHTYASTGEMTSVTRLIPESSAPQSTYQYGYDPSSRLTGANLVSGDGSGLVPYSYAYDAAGNRTLEQGNGPPSPLSFNNLNQAAVLKYDRSGNLTADATRSYEWDAADRLTAIVLGSHRSEFTYDGLSRRVRITERDNGVVTSDHQVVWCGGAVCEERAISSGGAKVIKRFFAQGETEVVNGSDVPYYYTKDQLGNIRQLTDSTGSLVTSYDYDPWGRTTKIAGGKDAAFTYAGYYTHLPSGLQLTQYRAYDANAGRWLSRDPVGETGGVNLYSYVSNRPVDARDRTGLFGPIAAAAGVLLALVISEQLLEWTHIYHTALERPQSPPAQPPPTSAMVLVDGLDFVEGGRILSTDLVNRTGPTMQNLSQPVPQQPGATGSQPPLYELEPGGPDGYLDPRFEVPGPWVLQIDPWCQRRGGRTSSSGPPEDIPNNYVEPMLDQRETVFGQILRR